MNLLERLKPEYQTKLEVVNKYYPTSYNKIINSLKNNQSVFGLTLDQASSICTFLDIETTLNNLINLFNE